MKVYHKLTQNYNLKDHPKKAFYPTNKVAVVTANLSEIRIATSLLVPKSSSAYSPTKFTLESPSKSTSYELNEPGINIVVEPGLVKTKFFEESKTAFDIKSSQGYPFAHFAEMTMKLFRTSVNSSPFLNLVAETTLNKIYSENRELSHLVGDYSEEIVKGREIASDNDFENALYEQIFREQRERKQPQQQQQHQYVVTPRTE